jgi:hypothetical protein
MQPTRFNECGKIGCEKRKNKEELAAKKYKMHKRKTTARGDAPKSSRESHGRRNRAVAVVFNDSTHLARPERKRATVGSRLILTHFQ